LGGFGLACAEVYEGTIDEQESESMRESQDFLNPEEASFKPNPQSVKMDNLLLSEENPIEPKYAEAASPFAGLKELIDFEDAKSCLSYTSIESSHEIEPTPPKPVANLPKVSVSTNNILRPRNRLPQLKKKICSQQQISEPKFIDLIITANSVSNLRRGTNIRRGMLHVGRPLEFPNFRQNNFRISMKSNLVKSKNSLARGQGNGPIATEYRVCFYGLNVRCNKVCQC
jgi:hypothetical protein